MHLGNIRFGQILVSGSIGFLVFFGILLTEKTRFEQVQYIKDPFEKIKPLTEEVVFNSKENEVRNIFTKSGEIIHIFDGTKLDFSNGNRELKKGTIVLSSHFISEKNKKLAEKSFSKDLDIRKIKPLVGQIKVQNILVNAPNSIVEIMRDLVRGEIEIYAHDHSVEVFFPNAELPYIIPPRHKIFLKENRLDKVGKLFYTKQNKEFNLKIVSPPINQIDETLLQTPETVRFTERFRGEIFEKIILYGKNAPLTWIRFQPSSLMGMFVDGIYYLQRYYALGFTKDSKKEYGLYKLRENIIDSFFYFKSKNFIKAEAKSQDFEKILHSNKWTGFFIKNPEKIQKWEPFERAHKIYIKNLYAEEKDKFYEKMWFPERKIDSFEVFKEQFFQVEDLISQKKGLLAKDKFNKLGESFLKVQENITLENDFEVTKIRRLLQRILKEENFFHTEELFDFYGKFILLEVSLYSPDNGEKQELSLESARNILYFLRMFIDQKTNSEIALNLAQVYRYLEVDKIAQSLGRSIFTDEEKETIKLVQFINGQELTDEDIRKIQEEQNMREWVVQQITETQEIDEEPDDVYIDDSIKTEEDLIQYLKEEKINTDNLQIKTQEKENTIQIIFSEAYFKKYALRGIFDTKRQEFNRLRLGKTNSTINPNLDIFGRILNKIYTDNRTNQLSQNDGPEDQNSNLGLLQKTYVSRALTQEGIKVDRKNIKPLDSKFTEFNIIKSTFKNRYTLSFKFSKKSLGISNISVEHGKSKFTISKVLKLKDLSKNLEKLIQEKIEIK